MDVQFLVFQLLFLLLLLTVFQIKTGAVDSNLRINRPNARTESPTTTATDVPTQSLSYIINNTTTSTKHQIQYHREEEEEHHQQLRRHVQTSTPRSGVTCRIPRFVNDDTWEVSLPYYPLRVKETHGTILLGTDIIIISGFIGNLSTATNHTYARDITGKIANGSWRRMDDIPVPIGITHAAYAKVGYSRIVLCGGFYGGNPGYHTPHCYVYNHNVRPGYNQQWSTSSSISDLPNGGTGGGSMVYSKYRNALFYFGGGIRRPGRVQNNNNLDDPKSQPPTRDVYDVPYFYQYKLSQPQDGWISMLRPSGALSTVPYIGNHISSVTVYDSSSSGKTIERHYFLGGQMGKDECSSNVRHMYEYNVYNKTFIKHPSLPYGRSHTASSIIPIHGGTNNSSNCFGFIIAGGSINFANGGASVCKTQYSTADISFYNSYTNRWHNNIGNLSIPISSPICIVGNTADHPYMYHISSGVVNRRKMIL